MKESKTFAFTDTVIIVPIIAVLCIWFVYWFEIKFDFNFNKYGVLPREVSGLKGIVFSPFIHSSTSHLFNNSVPLFVLTAALFLFYKKTAFRVLIFGTLATGFLTWIIGRDSYHIGASGVVYMLFSFVFFSGIIRKNYRLVALSLAIIFLYGSMMWYLFPVEDKISWEGHLSGFIVGLLFAIFYKNIGPQKEIHRFKQTEFDTWFDSEGNFSPPELSLEEE